MQLGQLANAAMQAHQAGDLAAAERLYRQFLAQAEHPAILANFGALLIRTGRQAEAVAPLQRAAALSPGSAAVLGNLGAALWKAGQGGRAERALAAALVLEPAFADALANLANLSTEARRFDRAIALLGRARRLKPDHPGHAFHLGVALQRQGRTAAAVEAYRAALALAPGHADAAANLGACLGDLGRLQEALAALDDAVALSPNDAGRRFTRAQTRLAAGDWAGGWAEFEQRWQFGAMAGTARDVGVPRWAGEPLAGRSLLLTAEQGLGDMVKFLRFVPDLADRCGRLVLEAYPALRPLAERLHPRLEVIGVGQAPGPIDFAAPLMSIAGPLGLSPAALPRGPYLAPPPERLARWRGRLADRGSGTLRAGLVWAGNPAYVLDHFRSPGLAPLRPLLDLPGVSWTLLQLGEGRRQLEGADLPADVLDLGPELGDFADTAAVMSLQDVVVSSDTATAHLAGALGCDTRVLVPALLDWRWAEAADGRALWYESARLYRQQQLTDWTEPVQRLADDLAALVGRRA
jgi:Tfp pilus assembly protein PilF